MRRPAAVSVFIAPAFAQRKTARTATRCSVSIAHVQPKAFVGRKMNERDRRLRPLFLAVSPITDEARRDGTKGPEVDPFRGPHGPSS